MIVRVLMEDTALPGYVCEHGLSLYLELEKHRILFDMGKSGAFLQNAAQMNVDVASAELVVLSHGHYDHGGGLSDFLQANDHAEIYMQHTAGEGHFSRRANGSIMDVGVSKQPLDGSRIVRVDGDMQLGEGLRLFSSQLGNDLRPSSNATLLIKENGNYIPDPFFHEQSLLIEENGRCFLIAGCAHRGIVNIVQRAVALAGKPMDAVIGGFHLSNPRDGGSEPETVLQEVAARLMHYPTRYYTGHCTGETAYKFLKGRMGAQLAALHAGSVITV